METYKNLVNEVLMRLREDAVTTIGSSRLAVTDDPVVDIVKLAVEDARRTVEEAHNWNALRKDWTITTVAGTPTYSLTGAGNRAIIESLYGSNGAEIHNVRLAEIKRKAAVATQQGAPYIYAVDGADANGDIVIRFHNTPNATDTIAVHGFQRSTALNTDSDKIKVPSNPVIYLAFALASRERGETGGAQSSELFGMARSYLTDAIALDQVNSDLDNDWTVV